MESLDAFDEVYISPHLDDVAFSCGGRILRERARGQSVLVVTVFTADEGPCRKIPPHVRARVGEMSERRREDERAMRRLNVAFLWLGYPEAIFRDRAYHTLYGAFSRQVPEDRRLAAHLACELAHLLEQVRPRRVYWPLGVGHHADHRLLFEAGVMLVTRRAEGSTEASRDLDVCFYEDAPYALIPYLVEHRMETAGVRAIRKESTPRRSAWARAREAYTTMMTLASVRAQVGAWALRIATRGFLLSRFAWAEWRARRGQPRLWLAPELCEIGSVLAEKLAVLAEYRSQIEPVLGDLQSYSRLRIAYSRRLASDISSEMPAEGIFERIWRVVWKVPDSESPE